MKRTPLPRKRTKPRRTREDRIPEYRAWLRSGICPLAWTNILYEKCAGPIDPCHTKNGGMQMKGPDSGCVPLCRFHHDQFDGRTKLPNGRVGKKAFEAYYGISMAGVASRWYNLYLGTKA